jgi:anti-sigma factor RsiW
VSCPSTERLSAFADGDLSRFSARRVARHIDGCARCQGELTALRATVAAMPSLSAPDDYEPPPADAAWAELAARLPAAAPPRPRRIFAWAMPLAAATAMAALGVVFLRGRGPSDADILAQADVEFRRAEDHYQRALTKLREAAEHDRSAWPASRRAAYENAQRALGEAREACRRVALGARDPDAEEQLFGAYQKEIAFYQDALGGRL